MQKFHNLAKQTIREAQAIELVMLVLLLRFISCIMRGTPHRPIAQANLPTSTKSFEQLFDELRGVIFGS